MNYSLLRIKGVEFDPFKIGGRHHRSQLKSGKIESGLQQAAMIGPTKPRQAPDEAELCDTRLLSFNNAYAAQCLIKNHSKENVASTRLCSNE